LGGVVVVGWSSVTSLFHIVMQFKPAQKIKSIRGIPIQVHIYWVFILIHGED